MKTIVKYFPLLSEKQIGQMERLYDLYLDWNGKINVISRKDIENLYIHHVLHSLSIAKLISFEAGTTLMDVGTGGGFPGVPLAILFPEIDILMVDSIGKKIKVAQTISQEIGLDNVDFRHCRAEEEKREFDFVVSRAVMPLGDLVKVTRKNISQHHHNRLHNGIICLKGGELEQEIQPFRAKAQLFDLSNYFEEPFFETKKLVYLPI